MAESGIEEDGIDKRRAGVQPVYIAVSPPSGGGIDLLDLWKVLWDGRWLIIGLSAITAVIGIIYSLSLTPVYRAETVLAPVIRNPTNALGELGGLASLAGINVRTGSDSDQALAVLRSRNFIAEFIQEKSLLPVLFPKEWDQENNRWIMEGGDSQRDIRDGVKLFVEDIRSISQDPQTGLVTLAIEWTNPEVSARWAAELVQDVNEKLRRRDIEESQKRLVYLHEQLAQANLVELRQAISRLIEEQISAMMLAQSQLEYAFTVIDPPVAPKQRVWPRRTIIVIVSTFLGGFIAGFVLVVNFSIRRRAPVYTSPEIGTT